MKQKEFIIESLSLKIVETSSFVIRRVQKNHVSTGDHDEVEDAMLNSSFSVEDK